MIAEQTPPVPRTIRAPRHSEYLLKSRAASPMRDFPVNPLTPRNASPSPVGRSQRATLPTGGQAAIAHSRSGSCLNGSSPRMPQTNQHQSQPNMHSMVRTLYASSHDPLPEHAPGGNLEQNIAKLQQENADLKRDNTDLHSANSSLHARNCLMERQLIGLEDALAHMTERNKVLEERNTALEAGDNKQASPHEFQAKELEDLRQQLDKQKNDMQQQLAEVEQERDNVLQAMAEEGLELQARIETLCQEKKALLGGDSSTNDGGTTPRALTEGTTVLPPDCGDGWGSCSSTGSPCSVNSSAPTAATRSGTSSPQVRLDCGAGLLLQAVAAQSDEQDASTASTCTFLSARDAEAMNRKLKLRDIENALLRRQLDTLRRAVQLNVACRLRSGEDAPDSASS